MASVRIENDAFADRRYNRLARLAGLADADHARGKLLVLWRQCTIENREVLPVEDVLDVLGENGVEALVKSNLGEEVDGEMVRIKGTKGRIEWKEKLKENGKKGGRPKKNQGVSGSKNQKVSKKEPIGFENENPTSTSTSTSTSQNIPAPSKSANPPAPPGYRELIDHFDRRYREHAGGSKPTWNKTTCAQVKRLLKAHGLDECLRRIDNLFLSPPSWLEPPFTIKTLEGNFDSLAAAGGRTATREPEALL